MEFMSDWFFFEQVAKTSISAFLVIVFAVELGIKYHFKSIVRRYRKYDLLHHIFHWCGLCGSFLLFLHGVILIFRQLTPLVEHISLSYLYFLTDHCTYCILAAAFFTIFQVQSVCYRQLRDEESQDGSMSILTFGMILLGIWFAILLGVTNMDIIILFDPQVKYRVITFGIFIISFIIIVSFIQWNANTLRETFCLLSPEVFNPTHSFLTTSVSKKYFKLRNGNHENSTPLIQQQLSPSSLSSSLSSSSSLAKTLRQSNSLEPLSFSSHTNLNNNNYTSINRNSTNTTNSMTLGNYLSCINPSTSGSGGGVGGSSSSSTNNNNNSPNTNEKSSLFSPRPITNSNSNPMLSSASPNNNPILTSPSKVSNLYVILRRKYEHFIFLVRTAQLLCLIAILIQFIQVITLLQNYFEFTYPENSFALLNGEKTNMESLFLDKMFFTITLVQDGWIWLQNFSLACMAVYAWVPLPKGKKFGYTRGGGGTGGVGNVDQNRVTGGGSIGGGISCDPEYNMSEDPNAVSEVLEIQESTSSNDEMNKSISAGTQATLTNWREEITQSSNLETRHDPDISKVDKDLQLEEKEARMLLMNYRKWAAANI